MYLNIVYIELWFFVEGNDLICEVYFFNNDCYIICFIYWLCLKCRKFMNLFKEIWDSFDY